MKITSKDKLLLILKTLWRIPAPFVVPFFLLFARKTDYVTTHLAQPSVQRYVLPDWLFWASTPDETLPAGLYEPTALKIYKVVGWFLTSWYWLGIRNVGSGIMWKRAIPLGAIYNKDIDHNNPNVLKAVAEQVKIDNNLLPVKWGIFKLHWELTKDFYGVLHDFKSEDWRKCGYVGKLEIGVW